MAEFLGIVAIGFVSGVLSGMFGIGGGIITTPAIRLLLDAPALVAVGTPLVAIIPSTVTGALAYRREGLADVRAGVKMGLIGALTAVAGAWLTRRVGGSIVLLATAALMIYVAAEMVVQAIRPRSAAPLPTGEEAEAAAMGEVELAQEAGASAADAAKRTGTLRLAGIGALTGFYSGFLGLGGGFVLVPMLNRWLRFDLKRAIGTSLVAIAVLSIPGAVTHWLLGNVDVRIAVGLVIGVIPGAALGARIAIGSSERALRLGFAMLLAVVGTWLAVTELGGLL